MRQAKARYGLAGAPQALAGSLVDGTPLGGRGGAPAPMDRETAHSRGAGPREADPDGTPHASA
jgi:hypothetical protein